MLMQRGRRKCARSNADDKANSQDLDGKDAERLLIAGDVTNLPSEFAMPALMATTFL